jgi:fructose-1,6-bisphosphatase/inositol monophosphatase family enzyme
VPARPSAATTLDGAFLEAYLKKPSFLYPTATALRPLFERARFILPNGGPNGFADVACGRIDVYFAWNEALTEVFSAIFIAERAGCVVTHWDGSPVRFCPDIHAVYSLVCSANPRLHEEVLQALKGITPPKGLLP